jgi:5-methylthioadenosine/S-adenosylhomocysteine deaminase
MKAARWCLLGLAVSLAAGCGPADDDLGQGDEQDLTERKPILLIGTVVTPDTAFDGQVLVEKNLITCAAPGTACAKKPAAKTAVVVDTHGGIIAPGLIDTHNHILFDVFDGDDWLPAKLYQNHDQWPGEAKYELMIEAKHCLAHDALGKPAWCPKKYTGQNNLRCELDKYGEMKGVVAGTTTIVGLAGAGSSKCFGSLARTIDSTSNELGYDGIQALTIVTPERANRVCENFASGATKALLIHIAEGVDEKSRVEFDKLGSSTADANCLYAPQTTITHGTALTAKELGIMGKAGMKLTWSPASNVALYGTTTDIPTALAAGVEVSLAPDWSMGGSVNMLDEMRFAAKWDKAHFGHILSSKEIVLMATKNPARAIGLADKVGQIKAGYAADLFVIAGDRKKPYDAILAATPKTVMLTMVNGVILYGDAPYKSASQSTGCETLSVCGKKKFACVAREGAKEELDQTFASVVSSLSAALVEVDALTKSDGVNFAPIAPLATCE